MSQTEMAMSEPETSTSAAENTGQALTIRGLLRATSFTVTVMEVIMHLKHAGGGVLRYMLGVPLALALGALIVWLNWSFQKFPSLKSEGATKRKEYAIVVVFLLSLLFFIAAGGFAGDMLASLLYKAARLIVPSSRPGLYSSESTIFKADDNPFRYTSSMNRLGFLGNVMD